MSFEEELTASCIHKFCTVLIFGGIGIWKRSSSQFSNCGCKTSQTNILQGDQPERIWSGKFHEKAFENDKLYPLSRSVFKTKKLLIHTQHAFPMVLGKWESWPSRNQARVFRHPSLFQAEENLMKAHSLYKRTGRRKVFVFARGIALMRCPPILNHSWQCAELKSLDNVPNNLGYIITQLIQRRISDIRKSAQSPGMLTTSSRVAEPATTLHWWIRTEKKFLPKNFNAVN